MIHSRSLLFALFCLMAPTLVFAREAKEQARIDFVLRAVETSKALTFIRNGKAHDAEEAATHLRRKLDYAGERIQTAEQFIQHAASESSRTRQKYKVRLADGTTLEAEVYLAKQLREFDARKQ